MKHARKDYDRIQDPAVKKPSLLSAGSTPIHEDEPVMLFRAQDENFVDVLDHYREMLQSAGNFDMASVVAEQAKVGREWQRLHGCKSPDMPRDGN